MSPTLNIIFDAIHALKTYNILPFSGGWLDQPDSFREIHEIFMHVENMTIERNKTRSERLSAMRPKRG